ncbi:MAG: SIMPL domain-containing protein [Pirellulales bacterium]
MRFGHAFLPTILFVVLAAGVAQAAESPRRLISVSGDGEVDVAADYIALRLIVTTDGDELLDARAANDKRATAIARLAGEQGVAADDLQTDDFDISAQFDKDQGFIRYRVVRTVAIFVRELPKFESVLAELIKLGGFKISAISLEHSQLAKHQAEARRRAYADARQKAAQLAELDGVKLGKAWRIVVDEVDLERTPFVTSVIPVVGDAPRPRTQKAGAAFQVAPEKQAAANAADASPVLAPGRITVSASVTIQFEAE